MKALIEIEALRDLTSLAETFVAEGGTGNLVERLHDAIFLAQVAIQGAEQEES